MRDAVPPPMFHKWARHSTYLFTVLMKIEGRGPDDPEVQEYSALVREEIENLDAYYGHQNWSRERRIP